MTFAVAYLYALGVVLTYAFFRYASVKEQPPIFTGIASKTAMAVSWPVSILVMVVLGLTIMADERWGK